MSERTRALEWIEAHAVDRPPVFLQGEIPESVFQTLKRLGLLLSLPGSIVVARSPGDEPETVLKALAWPIIEALTRQYAPAVVERDSAVRLYLGHTDPGPEIRIRQTGGTRWREEITPGVTARIERGPVSGSQLVRVGEVEVPVDLPERVLLMLPLQVLRDGLDDVALWLKSLVLSKPALVAAYRDQPRPVVLKRIEHLARDVGNERLADLLGRVLSEEQSVRIGRDRTGVGRELVVPTRVVRSSTTREPWLDRLRVSIGDSVEQIDGVLQTYDLPAPSTDLGVLLAGARESKAYDAYHSTSIEGYRLSFDEVSALFGGGVGGGTSIDDVRSKLAVIGYGVAFDRLLTRLEQGEGHLRLTADLALDLHADLFLPSTEAGIIAAEEARGWRTGPVFIRDTLFVPPNPQKLPRLVALLFDELEGLGRSRGLLRAVLVHLWFVWIHPFPDGNGRVARLLMNAALLSGGLPWTTIRVEERSQYFEALRQAQLQDDYERFARFIGDRVLGLRESHRESRPG